jgi:two-component system response regulator MprA
MSEPTRILVVDDDPKIRTVVRRGLAYEGSRVVEAESGEEGLEKAREHLPDLVILDVMMPGIDGLEVTRRLRSSGDEIAILMLTARDEVKDRVAGLEIVADDYLVKPFSFEELLARVHALLRRRSTSAGETLRFADLELDVDAREARRAGRTIELTTTEFTCCSCSCATRARS